MMSTVKGPENGAVGGKQVLLMLLPLVLIGSTCEASPVRGLRQSLKLKNLQSLWGTPGAFAGVNPWDVSNGLNESTIYSLYDPAALERARGWVDDGKQLWCGTASKPDSQPFKGVFPSAIPPTTTTNWPGACPKSNKAQDLFDMGLVWRMVFNDNEAACAFMAAGQIDNKCAMAHLGAALTMGPNVNYAFIANAEVYRLILESLKKAREALNSKAKQLPLAPAIYTALKYRYCVNEPGQLNHMLSLTAEMSFAVYQNSSVECETGYQNQTLMLADKYQEDPNVAVLATGALMEQPAWKWWQVGSVVAGALLNITINDNTTAGRSPMGQLSELMEAEAAISNLIMQRGMNTQPEHLGLLHYMIHNMEANPNPALALNVAEKLYNLGGSTQGHAAHMRTHIDMRVGDYANALDKNKVAVWDDALWNLARSGGGIMSVLYKYNPHNIAFIAEAAQHAGNWKELASSISNLNYGAGFPMVADVNQLSLNQYLMRQLTQPLRFGRYDDIIEGTTQGGPGPVQGAFANATVQVYLPGSSKGSVVTLPPVTCGNACYMWRTYARTVALGRKKMAEEAEAELNLLVANQCMSDSDLAMNVSIVCGPEGDLSGVAGANALGDYYTLKQKQTIVSGAVNTLDLNSSTASGTLTIDNSAAVYGVVMYMAAAEVQMAQEDPSYEELGLTTITLAKASALQDIMYYDEPAPFYYNVGETLAGWLMQQQEYDSAINYLRKTLFQWPRSALPTVALSEAMSNTPDADLYASAMTQLVAAATQLNDTVLDLAWL